MGISTKFYRTNRPMILLIQPTDGSHGAAVLAFFASSPSAHPATCDTCCTHIRARSPVGPEVKAYAGPPLTRSFSRFGDAARSLGPRVAPEGDLGPVEAGPRSSGPLLSLTAPGTGMAPGLLHAQYPRSAMSPYARLSDLERLRWRSGATVLRMERHTGRAAPPSTRASNRRGCTCLSSRRRKGGIECCR